MTFKSYLKQSSKTTCHHLGVSITESRNRNKLTSTKHATDVGMPLVKTFMYNRIDKQ